MNEDKISQIIQDKAREFGRLCEKTNKGFDQEAIHKLRVTYKSLRAFFRFLSWYYAASGIRIPKKISALYRTAGGIRDAQLERLALEKYEIHIQGYSDHLEATIKQRKADWKKLYRSGQIATLEEKLKLSTPGEVPLSALPGFLQAKIDLITSILQQNTVTDDQLHTIRKHIKDVLHNYKLAEKKWKAGARKLEIYPLAELSEMADVIGAYNDKRVLRDHLAGYATLVGSNDYAQISDVLSLLDAALRENQPDILKKLEAMVIVCLAVEPKH